MDDPFPPAMEVSFVEGSRRQTLVYEKVTWIVEGVEKGLRYGENPGQESALYRLVNGNLSLGEVTCISPGRWLASDVQLLQSGKHPGKTNITDVDNALNILRYFTESPCTVIVKHNNPCGVAKGASLADSYQRAYMADRIAAFGGAIAFNREVDRESAQLVAEQYCEVVAAPEYAPGVVEILRKRKNLRVMRIENMQRLQDYVGQRVVDFKSLIDGALVAQWSYLPQTRTAESFTPAKATYKGQDYHIQREPSADEHADLLFGWLVESGVSSNSVIYVKDGVTIGIGTGEQDRVGVAEIARDKAYRKLSEKLSWESYGVGYSSLQDADKRAEVDRQVTAASGGLRGSCMVSDGFFPFRDGVDVGIREGVTAIVQPGGSERDFESIAACNESDVAMVFTGQRSFKH